MTNSAGSSVKPGYYSALDGLRAVAVIMVFFQHYGAGKAFLFGWGWTGVDIFFVLSGFLITGILYDSRSKPRRYCNFYIRRTLRIFPLYYAVWAAIVILTPLAQWQWNWRWALWPAYLGNYARFFFLQDPGNPYRFDRLTFGPTVNAWFGGPMHLYIGHFWSLCVEEQFYLIWPFVVYQVRRRETLMKICITIIAIMPVVRWMLCRSLSPQILHMEFLYRSLPTRIDALLIGGLIALALRGPEQVVLRTIRRPLLATSAILFLSLYFIATRLLKLPLEGSASNWIAILGFSFIDLFAAALILECIHPGSRLSRILTFRPLRLLGTISYGFYVYHDLLHDFYSYFAIRYFPACAYSMTLITAFSCTLAIATISYRLLERPILQMKDRFTNQVHLAPRV